MHIMSMLWSMADAVSSGSCPILFKVLTLNVAIRIVYLHFSNFCFLNSVAYLMNTEATTLISSGLTPFLTTRTTMRFGHVVWLWVMVIFQWLFFFFIYRSHPYRWAAVVPRSNYRHSILRLFSFLSFTRVCLFDQVDNEFGFTVKLPLRLRHRYFTAVFYKENKIFK